MGGRVTHTQQGLDGSRRHVVAWYAIAMRLSSRPSSRLIAVLAGVLALAIGLPAAATAASTAGGSSIGIGAMRFAHPHAIATSFTTNTLTFTITDSHTAATGIGGDLFIRQQGPTPGTFIGDSYDIPFLFENSLSSGATFISGTPQSSTYSYVFAVPQYANANKVTWAVSQIVADDGLDGGHLDADPATLGRFGSSFTAMDNVDATKPSYQDLTWASNLGTVQHPFLYIDGTHPAVTGYTLTVQDSESGFWKGSLQFTGPSGQTVDAPFAFVGPNAETTGSGCGFESGGDMRDMSCGALVTFPADSTPGIWNVTQVTVFDNAGNELVDNQPTTTPITLTANTTISASHFTATPNPVNDWIGTATVQIGMTVTGTVGGVSSIFVENEATPTCLPGTSTPTVNADGSVSVPILMFQREPSCQITGIAIVDGAGNVALYGPDYGAPDPGLTITNVPDTTPPIATSASLSSTTITQQQVAGGPGILLIAQVSAQVAPVDEFSIVVYDAQNNAVDEEFGGTGVGGLDGTLSEPLPLPFFLSTGTYHVGFTISDAGGLTTAYGIEGNPNSQPIPGGPLTFTVTSS